MSNLRYKAQREHGSDWCVVDTRKPGHPQVVTGLTDEEAEQTANEWNKSDNKSKKNF